MCVCIHVSRIRIKKMTVTLNQNRNLNQSCILARGVLKERRRRRRKGGGACSEMPGGHVWGWAYFFEGGAAHVLLFPLGYIRCSKQEN